VKIERLRNLCVAALALGLSSPAALWAGGPPDYELLQKKFGGDDDPGDSKPWSEATYSLPPAPAADNLVVIDVGSTSENTFALDRESVTFGADDVIRYTLVVTSPSGARNVSYEGMRCATAERRLYAFGRRDGSWSAARNGKWATISDNGLNRHHAALYYDYFCTVGGMVSDTESARRVLKHGNPAARNR